eukprot:SAG11_NODE_35513_length_266_cov_0.622754_1_plen_58_part_10
MLRGNFGTTYPRPSKFSSARGVDNLVPTKYVRTTIAIWCRSAAYRIIQQYVYDSIYYQ